MELGHFFYDLLVHNEKFSEKSDDTDFSVYEDHQHPPITMLTCADSRIQGEILGMDLINKVFTVREVLAVNVDEADEGGDDDVLDLQGINDLSALIADMQEEVVEQIEVAQVEGTLDDENSEINATILETTYADENLVVASGDANTLTILERSRINRIFGLLGLKPSEDEAFLLLFKDVKGDLNVEGFKSYVELKPTSDAFSAEQKQSLLDKIDLILVTITQPIAIIDDQNTTTPVVTPKVKTFNERVSEVLHSSNIAVMEDARAMMTQLREASNGFINTTISTQSGEEELNTSSSFGKQADALQNKIQPAVEIILSDLNVSATAIGDMAESFGLALQSDMNATFEALKTRIDQIGTVLETQNPDETTTFGDTIKVVESNNSGVITRSFTLTHTNGSSVVFTSDEEEHKRFSISGDNLLLKDTNYDLSITTLSFDTSGGNVELVASGEVRGDNGAVLKLTALEWQMSAIDLDRGPSLDSFSNVSAVLKGEISAGGKTVIGEVLSDENNQSRNYIFGKFSGGESDPILEGRISFRVDVKSAKDIFNDQEKVFDHYENSSNPYQLGVGKGDNNSFGVPRVKVGTGFSLYHSGFVPLEENEIALIKVDNRIGAIKEVGEIHSDSNEHIWQDIDSVDGFGNAITVLFDSGQEIVYEAFFRDNKTISIDNTTDLETFSAQDVNSAEFDDLYRQIGSDQVSLSNYGDHLYGRLYYTSDSVEFQADQTLPVSDVFVGAMFFEEPTLVTAVDTLITGTTYYAAQMSHVSQDFDLETVLSENSMTLYYQEDSGDFITTQYIHQSYTLTTTHVPEIYNLKTEAWEDYQTFVDALPAQESSTNDVQGEASPVTSQAIFINFVENGNTPAYSELPHTALNSLDELERFSIEDSEVRKARGFENISTNLHFVGSIKHNAIDVSADLSLGLLNREMNLEINTLKGQSGEHFVSVDHAVATYLENSSSPTHSEKYGTILVKNARVHLLDVDGSALDFSADISFVQDEDGLAIASLGKFDGNYTYNGLTFLGDISFDIVQDNRHFSQDYQKLISGSAAAVGVIEDSGFEPFRVEIFAKGTKADGVNAKMLFSRGSGDEIYHLALVAEQQARKDIYNSEKLTLHVGDSRGVQVNLAIDGGFENTPEINQVNITNIKGDVLGKFSDSNNGWEIIYSDNSSESIF
jgi:hypothetical protein